MKMNECTPYVDELLDYIVNKDEHRYKVVCGGRRSGKTTIAVKYLVETALKNRDVVNGYLATNVCMRDEAAKIAAKELRKKGVSFTPSKSLFDSYLTINDTGSIISFHHAPKGMVRNNLSGYAWFDLLALDEINFFSEQDFLNAACASREVLCTGTPSCEKDRRCHLFHLVEKSKEDPAFASFKLSALWVKEFLMDKSVNNVNNFKNRLDNSDIYATIRDVEYKVFGCLTVCVLTLRNGFQLVGKSACVDPSNFDEEIGRQIAKEDAIRQIWMLEGYLLKQKVFDQSNG